MFVSKWQRGLSHDLLGILCQWLYNIATITSGMEGMRSKMKNDTRQCVLRYFLNGWYAFHMEMARHFNAIVRIIRFSCHDDVCVTALYVSIEALEVSIGIPIDLRIEIWQHSTCITETCVTNSTLCSFSNIYSNKYKWRLRAQTLN